MSKNFHPKKKHFKNFVADSKKSSDIFYIPKLENHDSKDRLHKENNVKNNRFAEVFHFDKAFREGLKNVDIHSENLKNQKKVNPHSEVIDNTDFGHDGSDVLDHPNDHDYFDEGLADGEHHDFNGDIDQTHGGDFFDEHQDGDPSSVHDPKTLPENQDKTQKIHNRPALKTFAVALLISGILIMSAGYLNMVVTENNIKLAEGVNLSEVTITKNSASKSVEVSSISSSSSSSIDPQVFRWQAESKLINDYVRGAGFFMGDLYIQGLAERGIKAPIDLDKRKGELDRLTEEYKKQYETDQSSSKEAAKNNSSMSQSLQNPNSDSSKSPSSSSNASSSSSQNANSSNSDQSSNQGLSSAKQPSPGSPEYIKQALSETKKPVFEIILAPEKLEDKEAEPKTKLEKKNLLIFPKYGVEVPIVYLEFDDLYRKNQNGDTEFSKPVDYELDRPVCRSATIYRDVCSPVQKKLELGAVHTPFSVNPGDVGNSYLAAHTSNWNFINSPYNSVFKPIEGRGQKGDIFYIYDAKGRKLEFSVFESLEIRAEDGNTAYKAYDDKRVVTLQGSVLKNVGGVLSPTHRWLIRGEIKN